MEDTKYCPDCGGKQFSWVSTQVEVGNVIEDNLGRLVSSNGIDSVISAATNGVDCEDCGESWEIAALADSDHAEDRGSS